MGEEGEGVSGVGSNLGVKLGGAFFWGFWWLYQSLCPSSSFPVCLTLSHLMSFFFLLPLEGGLAEGRAKRYTRVLAKTIVDSRTGKVCWLRVVKLTKRLGRTNGERV